MPCDILTALPPELVIEVFAFLDPASLTRCTAVSKGWRNLISNDLLWRRVATEQLGLCPATVRHKTLPLFLASELGVQAITWRILRAFDSFAYDGNKSYSAGAEDSVLLWTTTTTTMKTTMTPNTTVTTIWKSWSLSLEIPSDRCSYGPAGCVAHQSRPGRGTLIATSRKGGLYVLDIKTSQVLWQLGIEQVGAYEHLEGERGILVISNTRQGGEGFNVWVHRRLVPDGGNGDLYQCRSTLRPSQRSYASRFKWPVFCTMGEDCTASFWNLSDPGQPRQLMSIDIWNRYGSWEVKYIDFDDQHLFLVGREFGAVTVYNRATGQVKWSLDAHLQQTDARSLIHFYKLDLPDYPEDADQRSLPFELREQQLLAKQLNDQLGEAISGRSDGIARKEWVAIHTDEGTGALLVLGHTMLAIIPDFASLSESNCRAPIMMISHHIACGRSLPSESELHLSVADGRVFFAKSCPILLDLAPHREEPLTPGSAPFRLPEDFEDPPPLRIFAGQGRFLELVDRDGYHGCSCTQMDAANIFAVLPNTEARVHPDAEDEGDTREVLHWRIDGA
ncbi:unnamed protein product [Tilletia caries]|uniref:F-box domain-containing protein n=1 Tax=Tilletia caries TaxID=13290 RepID=A0ABN7J7H1_9BASI|nr:unnamed protein product [Tilletia caries]